MFERLKLKKSTSFQRIKLKKETEPKQVVYLSRNELCEEIKNIMKPHIGRSNYITRRELFIKLFGPPENYSEYKIFFLWDIVKKSFNWLRRTSNYFIISMPIKVSKHSIQTSTYGYFIVKDNEDALIYINQLRKSIKKMWYMIGRCQKAVKEKFYKELD